MSYQLLRSALIAALLLVPYPLAAQTSATLSEQFIEMTAVTGYEQTAAEQLLVMLPGTTVDRAGNVVGVLGTGTPVRLLVCPLDEVGYVVGRITDDGYLRLRRVGVGKPNLFDQGLEGHRVTVWGAAKTTPGVVSIPSTHLGRGRSSIPDRPFNVDDAYVDIGVDSAKEVQQLGIRLLDAVALAKRPHRYGKNLLAGPEAGRRAGCAAVARTYLDQPDVDGTVVIAFVVESQLRHAGLRVLSRQLGPFASTWFINYDPPERIIDERFGAIKHSDVPVQFSETAVETINLEDVETLTTQISAGLKKHP